MAGFVYGCRYRSPSPWARQNVRAAHTRKGPAHEFPHRQDGSHAAPRIALALAASQAGANTLNQNVSWTIDRAGTTTKYRVVAYRDSIYAGYNGSVFNAAKYAAPTVQSEYLAALWNADVESVRRTKSGAVASDVYNSKIVAEKSYMQSASTRVVTFEMCGNDGLQARSSFKGQSGTCDYSVLTSAENSCKTYVAAAMDFINANAYAGTGLKVISNLYYPGYNADNVQSSCTDRGTGARVNTRDKFLPSLARMNYWMCEYARQKGFECVDNFAEYMGSDYDSNGDGVVDSVALRFVPGESESSYVARITSTLRPTIRDANTHFASSSSSYDYIQSDDTHPTYSGGTVSAGLFGGTTGSGAARYTSFPGGRNSIWNQFGQERMGWLLSALSPASPLCGRRAIRMSTPLPPTGDDGVRITARRRGRGPGVAAAFVVVAIVATTVWVSRSRPSRTTGADAATSSPAGGNADAAAFPGDPSRTLRTRRPAPSAVGPVAATGDGVDPSLDLADYVLPGEAPRMEDVIAELHRRGIRTGLGAFPPPGTSPPLRGLEVPDGFALPPGYVRHF